MIYDEPLNEDVGDYLRNLAEARALDYLYDCPLDNDEVGDIIQALYEVYPYYIVNDVLTRVERVYEGGRRFVVTSGLGREVFPSWSEAHQRALEIQ